MCAQQSLVPAVTSGLGGGQLMAMLVPACAAAADATVTPPGPAADRDQSAPVTRLPGRAAAAGCVPLTHLGSVHSIADAATGGTPLTQSGVVQPAAAATVRPSDPAVTAAEITAPAATRLT